MRTEAPPGVVGTETISSVSPKEGQKPKSPDYLLQDSMPPRLEKGAVIPRLINVGTWGDRKTGNFFALGREMLGRGNGAPDPSNSVLLVCDRYGSIIRRVVVSTPNEKKEQYEDWRADVTDHGTVILGATWTEKMPDGKFNARLAWAEVPTNWDGELGNRVQIAKEAGFGKNATPWKDGTRMLFRPDGYDSKHVFYDFELKDGVLVPAGEVRMPQKVKDRFIKSGTTYSPRLRKNGSGEAHFHFQEERGGKIVYSLVQAEVHMNGGLTIDELNLESPVTRASFRGLNIRELRTDLPIEVVYMTGSGFINIADQATVIVGFPR